MRARGVHMRARGVQVCVREVCACVQGVCVCVCAGVHMQGASVLGGCSEAYMHLLLYFCINSWPLLCIAAQCARLGAPRRPEVAYCDLEGILLAVQCCNLDCRDLLGGPIDLEAVLACMARRKRQEGLKGAHGLVCLIGMEELLEAEAGKGDRTGSTGYKDGSSCQGLGRIGLRICRGLRGAMTTAACQNACSAFAARGPSRTKKAVGGLSAQFAARLCVGARVCVHPFTRV